MSATRDQGFKYVRLSGVFLILTTITALGYVHLVFLRFMPASGIFGHKRVLILVFWAIVILISIGASLAHIPSSCARIPTSFHPCQNCYLFCCCCFRIAILTEVTCQGHRVVFIRMVKDAKKKTKKPFHVCWPFVHRPLRTFCSFQ